MQINQTEDKAKLHRDKTREAISLATQGQWQKAVEVNRALLAQFPNDVEALNRLGKAQSELGCYSEARAAFQRTLEYAPSNSIARKNLGRLEHLEDAPAPRQADRVTPRLFIEERGKSCLTTLHHLPPNGGQARVAAGDIVSLQIDSATVRVVTRQGDPLGQLEPKLAARLIKLMNGGNQYVAAVASVVNQEISLIIREVYQHPNLTHVVSFPSRSGEMPTYVPSSGEELEEEDDVDHSAAKEWTAVDEGGLEEPGTTGEDSDRETRNRPKSNTPSDDEDEEEM